MQLMDNVVTPATPSIINISGENVALHSNTVERCSAVDDSSYSPHQTTGAGATEED